MKSHYTLNFQFPPVDSSFRTASPKPIKAHSSPFSGLAHGSPLEHMPQTAILCCFLINPFWEKYLAVSLFKVNIKLNNHSNISTVDEHLETLTLLHLIASRRRNRVIFGICTNAMDWVHPTQEAREIPGYSISHLLSKAGIWFVAGLTSCLSELFVEASCSK